MAHKRKYLAAAMLTAAGGGAAWLALGNFFYSQLLTARAAATGTGGLPTQDILAGKPSQTRQSNFLIQLLQKLIGMPDHYSDPHFLALQEGVKWYAERGPQKAVAASPRGGRIHADLFIQERPSDVWIVNLHGYSSCPRDTGWAMKRFDAWGYNFLVPHLRGHGDSECEAVSMGWLDRFDIAAWIKYLNREYNNPQIVLYGGSMGGAAVMMATGEALPDNVVCAIEDCGYSSVWDLYAHQAKETLRLGPIVKPGLSALDMVARLRAGFSIREASCVEQLRKSKTPTLFIHGDADNVIPFRMLQEVYDACPCEKEMLVVPGAGHGESQYSEELYFGAIKRFIGKHLRCAVQS